MVVRGRNFWAGLVAASVIAQPVSAETPRRFHSETPAPRIDYWQKRQTEIITQLQNTRDLSAMKLVFIGDSITDFLALRREPLVQGQVDGKADLG